MECCLIPLVLLLLHILIKEDVGTEAKILSLICIFMCILVGAIKLSIQALQQFIILSKNS